MVVYHGGKMEASKPVIFVTRHLNVAQSYAAYSEGKIHKFELDIKNPANNDVIDAVAAKLGIEGTDSVYSSTYEYLTPSMVGEDEVRKMIKALTQLGYDSDWIDGDFSMDSDFSEYDSFVIWNASQLKRI